MKFGEIKAVQELGVFVGKNGKKMDTESRTRAGCRLKNSQKKTLAMNIMLTLCALSCNVCQFLCLLLFISVITHAKS
jgi:hypothetical protein